MSNLVDILRHFESVLTDVSVDPGCPVHPFIGKLQTHISQLHTRLFGRRAIKQPTRTSTSAAKVVAREESRILKRKASAAAAAPAPVPAPAAASPAPPQWMIERTQVLSKRARTTTSSTTVTQEPRPSSRPFFQADPRTHRLSSFRQFQLIEERAKEQEDEE